MDSTELERLVVTLEANTAKLDKTISNSQSLLDRNLKAMEDRLGAFGSRSERVFADFGKNSLNKFASQLGPIGALATGMGGGLLVAGAAAGALAYALEQGNAKLAAHEKLLGAVQGVLTATSYASGQTADSIDAMATRISASTLQTRDDVLAASTELATFGNIGPESFEKILRLAADMSQVFGIDLQTAVKQLGKAFEDPINNLTALRRIGIEFSPAQKEMIRNFQESGDMMHAQGIVADALAGKMGGASAGAKTGLAGAMHDLNNEWDVFLENAAKFSDKGGLIASTVESIATAFGHVNANASKAGGLLEYIANLAAESQGGRSFDTLAPKAPPPRNPNADYVQGDPSKFAAQSVALAGPSLARDRALADNVEALGKFRDGLVAANEELKKSPLKQAIDKAIEEAAKQLNVSPAQLVGDASKHIAANPAFAPEVQQIVAAATAHYQLEEAIKNGKKSAEDAKKAEKKLAETREQGWKVVADLQNAASGKSGRPGAERLAAMQEATSRLPDLETDFATAQKQTAAAAAAGAQKFDNESLTAEIDKGKQLVQTYQDETSALGQSRAAAEAAKFEHDALAEIFRKEGFVSDDARRAIEAQTAAILAAGQAAEKAQEQLKQTNEVISQLDSGIDKMGNALVESLGTKCQNAFKRLREAAHGFLIELAQMTLKMGVLQPAENALFGKPGQPGGLLGGAMSWLTGGSSSLGKPDGSMTQPLYVIPLGAGGIGGGGLGDLSSSLITPNLPNIGADGTLTQAAGGAAGGGGFFSGIGSFISSLFAFAGGGKIPGAGGGNSDRVLVRASPGERIFDAKTSAENAGLFDLIESGHPLSGLPMFAGGGSVGARMTPSRIGAIPKLQAPAHAVNMPVSFHIDARGGEIGVEDKIQARLQEAAPGIIAAALKQATDAFPYTLKNVLDTHG